jgi:thioredoxin-like negative regulator of GroEL
LNCNFNYFILSIFLVYFLSYAPWCSACQQFKSVWNEFSQAMIQKNIKVAAINVEEYPSLSGRFGISALPTIFQ